jgi:DNA-binding YbaB/EbfC family protein
MFKELGSLANLAGLMKNAQALTGKMQEARNRLAERRVTGIAGGGMVSVEMNGHSQVTGCQIDASLFASDDREMVEDLIVAAANQALEKVKQAAAEEMGQVAQGLDVPGLSDALSRLGLGGFPER